MERASAKKYEMVEVDGWHQLREEAPLQAEALIGAIHGYEDMTAQEQLEELRTLLGRLTHDNDNRFIAEEIAKHIKGLHVTGEYQKVMTPHDTQSTFSIAV
jgi:hypothetical protein